MPDQFGQPYAFELRTPEENERRLREVVRAKAEREGKTEQQVIDELVASLNEYIAKKESTGKKI